MAIPNIDTLYECGSALSAAKAADYPKYEEQYKTILLGVKSHDTNTKKLSSQFIARFFAKYPNLANQALDAILDLCEDEDVEIRKQAIKDLPSLCREMKEFLPKIADVLSQLLQSEDKNEIVVIQNSLISLFRRDAKGTLIGLFSQVRNGGDVVRDRALKFLHMKLKTEGSQLIASKDTEAVLLDEIKHSIEDCTADEFHMFMSMLGATCLPKSVSGQSMIVELIAHSCQLDKFDAGDEEAVDRFLACASSAIPYFSSQVKSTQFAEFMTSKVLPALSLLDSEVQNSMLKLLGEVCMFTGIQTNAKQATESLYKLVLESVPQQNEENNTDDLNFIQLESLLFAFHTMSSQAPEYLADSQERQKEFKTGLQYFALTIQAYTRKLDEFIRGKNRLELNKEENKKKMTAHRSAKNISSIIKDLFHSPPSYKSKIIVSWRPQNDKAVSGPASNREANNLKRKSISFEGGDQVKKPALATTAGNNKKRPLGSNKVYAPPQGKYSSNLGKVVDDDGSTGVQQGRQGNNYHRNNRGRGFRRGGGGGRRRGRY